VLLFEGPADTVARSQLLFQGTAAGSSPPLLDPSAGGRNSADDGSILLLVQPGEKNKATKLKPRKKKSCPSARS
jgi:hypothetical protein